MRKQHYRKTLIMFLVASIVLNLTLYIPSYAAKATSTTIELWIGNPNMMINGTSQAIDAQGTTPILSENRTLVPIRAIIEAVGGTISWTASSQKITIMLGKDKLEMWIDYSDAVFNGSSLPIDSANKNVVPVTKNDRTMIPLRFVAETFGMEVKYDDSANKISLRYAPWEVYTFDGFGKVGSSNTSIALDKNDKIHISYIDDSDGMLKYLTDVSGQWMSTAVGSATGANAISVDAYGKVHMVYNSPDGKLNYATNASGSAGLIHTIDTGVWTWMGAQSIAVDLNGKVHLIYFYGNKWQLKYATNASGNWVTSVLADGSTSKELPTYSASIGVDSKNKIHICYYDDTSPDSIKYVTNASGNWVKTIVDSIGMSAGWSTSLAVDSNDKIHIAYYNFNDKALKYSTNASGAWRSEIVDNSGSLSSASIVVDRNNMLHIVYRSGKRFTYAKVIDGEWQKFKIDEAWTGGGNSIAIGSDAIYVSYQDGYVNKLKYAVKPLY